MNTVSSCFVHGDHEGEECPLCEAIGAIRAARVIVEAARDEGTPFDGLHVIGLHNRAIAALERVTKPAPRRDRREERWK